MVYNDIVKYYGGLAQASRALDIPKTTVHSWMLRGVVPAVQQLIVQKKNPRLRADRSIVKKYRELLGS